MPREGASRADWLIMLVIAALFVAGGVVFLRAQNVWIDETTQLSGMALSLPRMIAWLTGTPEPTLGVPPDRMPPISYLFDAAFWRVWGDNIQAFRLLHLIVAASGLVVLLAAVRRVCGTAAMTVTGLLLVLLPKLTDIAVEIRAYPLVFAIACIQVAMLLTRRGRLDWRWLAGFAAVGLVASYTHFFGVVATSAFFVALFVASGSRAAAIRVVAVYAALAVSWVGLAPFIVGAASASGIEDHADMSVGGIFAYLLRLMGHSANLLSWPGTALLAVGALTLLGISIARVIVQGRREGLATLADPVAMLIVAVLAGVAATLAAGFVAAGFNPTKPSYSIWMLPVLAVLIGAAFRSSQDGAAAAAGEAAPRGLASRARIALAAVMLIGAAWGHWDFLSRAAWFTHGPDTALSGAVAAAGPDSAVVYVGPTWPYGFYPLYWHQRDGVDQWLIAEDGSGVRRIGVGGDPTTLVEPFDVLDRYRAIVIARIDVHDYRHFRAFAAGASPDPGPIVDQGFPNRHWSAGPAETTLSFFGLTAQQLTRDQASAPR